MIKVSVIIPIYNMERYLSSGLDSVLSQTLQEIEIVCVDDGSVDRTPEILKQYSSQDSRIRILTQENQGVGTARNNGLKAASGKYVAFLDPDDYYPDTNVLRELYEAAEKNCVLICGGSLVEDHDDGKWFRQRFVGNYTNYTFKNNGYISYRDYQYDYGFYRFIYDRKFLIQNQIFFPPYIRFQDPPFFVHAMIQANGFYALKRVTYCYRAGHQNFSWSEKRICALLSGLVDDLRMSSDAQLARLHCLTLERMLYDFREPILNGLISRDSHVWELFEAAERILVPEYVALDIDCKRGLKPLRQEYERRHTQSNGFLDSLSNIPLSNRPTLFKKIINRFKLYFRLARKRLYRLYKPEDLL